VKGVLGSEDRQRVLSQHRDLRAILASLEDAARRVRAFEPGGVSALRDGVRHLDTAFRAHLAFEESLLLPALSEHALSRLRAEHGEQRTMLAALSSEVERDASDAESLAADALWLVGALLKDMRAEDQALESGAISGDGG
jgi:hemerythrin-like domain-containing protein